MELAKTSGKQKPNSTPIKKPEKKLVNGQEVSLEDLLKLDPK